MKYVKALAIAVVFGTSPVYAGDEGVSLEHQEHGHIWGRCGHCDKY